MVFLKNGPTRPLFHLFLFFSNTHYKFYNKYVCDKMSIQYMVRGFELMTFEHESPLITTRPPDNKNVDSGFLFGTP